MVPREVRVALRVQMPKTSASMLIPLPPPPPPPPPPLPFSPSPHPSSRAPCPLLFFTSRPAAESASPLRFLLSAGALTSCLLALSPIAREESREPSDTLTGALAGMLTGALSVGVACAGALASQSSIASATTASRPLGVVAQCAPTPFARRVRITCCMSTPASPPRCTWLGLGLGLGLGSGLGLRLGLGLGLGPGSASRYTLRDGCRARLLCISLAFSREPTTCMGKGSGIGDLGGGELEAPEAVAARPVARYLPL